MTKLEELEAASEAAWAVYDAAYKAAYDACGAAWDAAAYTALGAADAAYDACAAAWDAANAAEDAYESYLTELKKTQKENSND